MRNVSLLTILFTLVAIVAVAAEKPVDESDANLEVWENDNQSKPVGPVFYKHPGEGHQHSGSYKDLDDREIEWNDKIKSVILHGPPGTTVWLYDSKNFGDKDDILEIKIPDGQSSVVSNDIDKDQPAGVKWIKHKNGIAGKVSGIQWK